MTPFENARYGLQVFLSGNVWVRHLMSNGGPVRRPALGLTKTGLGAIVPALDPKQFGLDMPYDYTFVLRLQGVKKAKAAAYRDLIDKVAASKSVFGSKDGPVTLTPEDLVKTEKPRFKAFGILEEDLRKIIGSVSKKFQYDTVYEGYKTADDMADDELSRTKDADLPEAEDWVEWATVNGDEINGWDCQSGTLYADDLSDDIDAVKAGLRKVSEKGCRRRLIIFTHGNKASTRIGGRSPQQLAALLARMGLSGGAESLKVSLVACFAGLEVEREDKSTDSYGQKLHEILGRTHGVYCDLTARIGTMKAMWADEDGAGYSKFVDMADDPTGETKDMKRKAPGSKIQWSWKHGKQEKLDVYAAKAAEKKVASK